MAVSGDMRILSTMGSYPFNHSSLGNSFSPHKVAFKCVNIDVNKRLKCNYNNSLSLSPETPSQETQNLVFNAASMSFAERLELAWKILFPTGVKKSNAASVAKQRLKMILFSDRCAVSEDAKQRIVANIIGALSDFVEIDSRDKVQLSVSADSDLGTVCSVTVPVRRVKAEYQDGEQSGTLITNIEYRDKGEDSGSVDVRFDFFVPDENDD